jgi:predicted lysophospholipase L1 biosynthesis ABC-type transport system permease subunit
MKALLSLVVAALGAILAYAGLHSPEGIAWFHLLGMGLSVLALILIWVLPGDQPKQPPP